MYVLNNLLKRKGRTIMTMIAIAVSMGMLIAMLSVSEGVKENTRSRIEGSPEDIRILTESFYGINGGHQLVEDLKNDTENLSSVAGIVGGQLFIPSYNTNGVLGSSAGAGGANVTGEFTYLDKPLNVFSLGIVPDDVEKFIDSNNEVTLAGLEIKVKDWFDIGGDPHFENGYTGPRTNEVIIDTSMMRDQGLNIGSILNLTYNEVSYQVTVAGSFSTSFTGDGIVSNYIQGIVIMHLSELQSLIGKDISESGNETEVDDKISIVIMKVDPDKSSAGKIENIANGLQEKYQYYTIQTKEQRFSNSEDRSVIAEIFYTAVGSVALVIGMLFVMCIVLINVNEQTADIGTLRAIGISKSTIFRNIVLESVLIIALGCAVGILLGFWGSQMLGDYMAGLYGIDRTYTAITVGLVVRSLLYVGAAGLIFSLYPAWKATRMNIVEAIRWVG